MAQLRKLWVEARAKGLVPKDMTLVEFRKIFDLFKINANTMRSYRPGEFDGRITLFSAEEYKDPYIFRKRAQVEPEENPGDPVLDPLKGWGALAKEGVDVQIVPGDHFSMIREPHVQVLAEKLRQCIQEALAASSQ